MPLYCVHGIDKPEAGELRATHYTAHRAYLDTADAAGITLHASGPLMSSDGTRMIGSLFVLEAADEVAVHAFNAADPFAQAALWERVSINRFILRRGSVGTALPQT